MMVRALLLPAFGDLAFTFAASLLGLLLAAVSPSFAYQLPPAASAARPQVAGRNNNNRRLNLNSFDSPSSSSNENGSGEAAAIDFEDDVGSASSPRSAAMATTSRRNFDVSPPTKYGDYEGIGSLLVDAFDSTPLDAGNDGGTDDGAGVAAATAAAGMVESALWKSGLTKQLSRRRYTNRYISTARKMRGKKYALVLGRALDGEQLTKGSGAAVARAEGGAEARSGKKAPRAFAPGGTVVGMAEVGLSSYPLLRADDPSGRATTDVVASIGVLAVHPTHRRSGVGSALVEAAEREVRGRWGERFLYVAVEPVNRRALRFFEKLGYGIDSNVRGGGDGGTDPADEALLVSVEVTERLRKERRPHLLLRKEL